MSAPPTPRLRLRDALPRIGRVLGANERLVANPVLRAASAWLFWLIPFAVSGDAGGFSTFASSAADRDLRLIDLLGGSHHDVAVAAVAAWVLWILVDAWLLVAFCTSIRDGRVDLGADLRTFGRVAALNLTAWAAIFAVALWSLDAALPAQVAISIATFYAPYLIALEGEGLGEAMARNARLVGRSTGPVLAILLAAFLAAVIGFSLLDQPVIDGARALPLMVLAAVLFDGLLAYASDCAAIGVLLELGERSR